MRILMVFWVMGLVTAIGCDSKNEATDSCVEEPCQNGSTCQNLEGDDFSCQCAAGFSGALCETDSDDCSPSLCLNGSTCTDALDSFSCTCASGFSGTLCETNIDDCSPNPCENDGFCDDGVDSFACICAQGFAGTICETDEDDCAPNPCENDGVCTDAVADFSCECLSGFLGSLCSVTDTSCGIGVARTSGADGGSYRNLGYSFTVSETAVVHELGAYNFVGTIVGDIGDEDIAVDGISDSIQVGLYDESTLLASATVAADSPLSDQYRYAAITPISLSPGTTYSVIGVFGTAGYFGYSVANTNYDDRVSYVAMQSLSSNTLPAAPVGNSQQWSDEYDSVNFKLCAP